ncbi:MAG: hypothetical protein HYW45_00110 [Candidatus Daviesbacteria bacterium]|nr:MAG: hypothetical protein HYW45_00110 [Candidatus Daviesbacteria bacterium]
MQNIQGAIDHLKNHQTYPATKENLIQECNKLSDFSEEDKKEFMDNLPEGNYTSAEEVMEALGWKEQEGMPKSQGTQSMA